MEFWTMSDGTSIEISKMTDNHIKNTIRFLENKNYLTKEDEEWLDIFEDELKKREKKENE